MFDNGVMASIKLAIGKMTKEEEIKAASKAVNELLRRRWNELTTARAQQAAAAFHVGQEIYFDAMKGRNKGRWTGKIESINQKTATVACAAQRGALPTTFRVHPSMLRAIENKPVAAAVRT